MANEDSTLTEVFTDIADAIRAKGGLPDTVKMSSLEMPAVISALPVIDPEDYYTKSETSSAAEISAADEGVRSYAADAIGYISSEVSADVDSTNVKHISACYLTDYVELSTSGTPDPDTLYFCVG